MKSGRLASEGTPVMDSVLEMKSESKHVSKHNNHDLENLAQRTQFSCILFCFVLFTYITTTEDIPEKLRSSMNSVPFGSLSKIPAAVSVEFDFFFQNSGSGNTG